MDAGFLIKIFEFFKNIPQKILWALLLFPFGIEFLTFNDAFNHFLNEYSFIKSITWLISLFSLLCLIFTYIEIVINYLRQQKSERKQQAEQEALDRKRKEVEESNRIEEATQILIENKRESDRFLNKILNLSNKSKVYLLIDFYCNQRKEHRILEKYDGIKYAYYNELGGKRLISILQKNYNRDENSWEILCRISPQAIEFLKNKLIPEKIIASLPKEYQEQVMEEISTYEFYASSLTKISP